MSNKKQLNTIFAKHFLQAKANYLFDNEPGLETIAHNLVNFITPHFHGQTYALIEECFIAAFRDVNLKLPFTDNVRSYLQGIVEPAWILLEKRIAVETKNGLCAWIPMQESIDAFLKRYEPEEPIMVDEKDTALQVSKREASLMLSVHIMPAHAVSMSCQTICATYCE